MKFHTPLQVSTLGFLHLKYCLRVSVWDYYDCACSTLFTTFSCEFNLDASRSSSLQFIFIVCVCCTLCFVRDLLFLSELKRIL